MVELFHEEVHNICLVRRSESGSKTKNKIRGRFFDTYECALVNH